MFDNHKKDFSVLMDATMPIFGQESSKPTKLLWWNLLAAYDFSDVGNAFAQHLKMSKFAPRPADIIQLIDKMHPDGRVDADEAWALIPKDEATSAILSDEMMQAWGRARELYEGGDRVGARMAFRDTYNRLTEQSKLEGKKPAWTLSLGWDVKGRDAVIEEGVRLGRLDAAHIASAGLLPDRSNTGIAAFLINGAESTLKLAPRGDQVEDANTLENVRGKLAGLRAAIGRA